MAKVITAPALTSKYQFPSLFIAGAITGAPWWQTELIEKIKDLNINIYNPRREHFDVNNNNLAKEQIEWEYRALNDAYYISFWFPKETTAPIALFELGRWSILDKPLFVGVEPYYPRRKDILIQMGLARPGLVVVDSLDALSKQIMEYFQ